MSSSQRRSNGSGSGHRQTGSGSGHRPSQSQSSSSAYSGSIQEITGRPSTSAGPRRQTDNTAFYSGLGGVADITNADRVNRPQSSASIPPYTSERLPSYHSGSGSGGAQRQSGSGSGGRPATQMSDPPSYHSRPTSGAPGYGQQQPGYGQQQPGYGQQQQYQPAPQQQQHLSVPGQQGQQGQGQGRRPNVFQRSSERLRSMFRRRERGEGSGSSRRER